jgi:L-aspartate oxidase
MKMANMDDYFDVVIVGTGAAGLYCALNLPARYRILLLTKQKADESDSFLAQGGICMQHGEADYRPFFDDTMRAGHYENNPATVDLMIRSSNSIIRDLVRRGVRFARDDHGALRFTREGAHSRPRILFHEDITGHEITQTLLNEVLRCENIELREHTTLLDFFADASACGGVIAVGPDGEPRAIGAGAVVLACGGIGGHLFTQDLIQRRKEPLHLLGCANRDAQIVRDARRVEVAD